MAVVRRSARLLLLTVGLLMVLICVDATPAQASCGDYLLHAGMPGHHRSTHLAANTTDGTAIVPETPLFPSDRRPCGCSGWDCARQPLPVPTSVPTELNRPNERCLPVLDSIVPVLSTSVIRRDNNSLVQPVCCGLFILRPPRA